MKSAPRLTSNRIVRLSLCLLVVILAACSGPETKERSEAKSTAPGQTMTRMQGAGLSPANASAIWRLCNFSLWLGAEISSEVDFSAGMETSRHRSVADLQLPIGADALQEIQQMAGKGWSGDVRQLILAGELVRSLPVPSGGELVFEAGSGRLTLNYNVLYNPSNGPLLTCVMTLVSKVAKK